MDVWQVADRVFQIGKIITNSGNIFFKDYSIITIIDIINKGNKFIPSFLNNYFSSFKFLDFIFNEFLSTFNRKAFFFQIRNGQIRQDYRLMEPDTAVNLFDKIIKKLRKNKKQQ